MSNQLTLFDTHTIRRDAEFIGSNRVRLSRDWADGPRALVIGCNPSTADALGDDPTSRWWNKWFQAAGFGGYDAANLYPICTSSPVVCREILGEMQSDTRNAVHDVNLPALQEMARTASRVFVCWGNIAWDTKWTNVVCSKILAAREQDPCLWCWGTTQSGAPKHPLARGKHRIARDQEAIRWYQPVA